MPSMRYSAWVVAGAIVVLQSQTATNAVGDTEPRLPNPQWRTSPPSPTSTNRNLRAPEKPSMAYGEIWLLPYMTKKDPAEDHPEA